MGSVLQDATRRVLTHSNQRYQKKRKILPSNPPLFGRHRVVADSDKCFSITAFLKGVSVLLSRCQASTLSFAYQISKSNAILHCTGDLYVGLGHELPLARHGPFIKSNKGCNKTVLSQPVRPARPEPNTILLFITISILLSLINPTLF